MKRRRLTHFLFRKRFLTVIFAVSILVLSVFAPLKSYILQWLLEASSINGALKYLLLGICVTLVSHSSEYILRVTFGKMSASAVGEVRNAVAEGIVKMPLGEYVSSDSGDRLSLLTNDIRSMNDDYYTSIFDMLMWGGMGIVAIGMLAYIDPLIMAMAVAMGILPLTVPKLMGKVLGRYRKDYSSSNSAYISKVGELLRGFETISLSGAKGYFTSRQKEAAEEDSKALFALQKMMGTSAIATSLAAWFPNIMVLFVGVLLVFNGRISLGSLITANSLTSFVLGPMRLVSNAYVKYRSSAPIKAKLENAMNYCPSETGNGKIDKIEDITFSVQSFTYAGAERPAINDISFKLHKGEKIAVVGESGSGKSTVAKLLLKYYDGYSGEIDVDSCELRKLDTDSYFSRIAVIPQSPAIFTSSIKDNLCLGRGYSDPEIENALKVSGLDSFIKTLPEGINTVLTEGGHNLSGGQAQRVAIARAVLRGCDVMVIDEATSSLDVKITAAVMDSLLGLDCAELVITHDIFGDYMKRFDKIYYLKNGKIAESGTFTDLITQNSSFAQLYEGMAEV